MIAIPGLRPAYILSYFNNLFGLTRGYQHLTPTESGVLKIRGIPSSAKSAVQPIGFLPT